MAAILPAAASAQTVEADISPTPGPYAELQWPTSYKLTFETPGIEISAIKDNTSYEETPPIGGEAGASPTWTGLFGRVQISGVDSQPLEITVNPDFTVTLNFSSSKVPYLQDVLSSEQHDFSNFYVRLPEGLFTITGTDDEGQDVSLTSAAMTFTYYHLGDTKITDPVINPENGTQVSQLKEIGLDFDINLSQSGLQWQVMRNRDDLDLFYKAKGETEWTAKGKVTVRNNFNDPHQQKLVVNGPAITESGQYYITVPFNTFNLVAEKALDGTRVAQYVNPELTLRYAIGEDVNDHVGKNTFLASTIPAEGDINLIEVPSGVEFIRMVCTSIPEIDRSITEPICLYLNDSTEPLRSVMPSDSEVFYVQSKGIANDYENEVRLWMDRGQSNIADRGDYTMKFPAGLFVFPSGETSDAFELKWHIDATLDYRMNPEMEAKLNKLDQITLTFPNASDIVISETNTKPIDITGPAGAIAFDITLKNNKVAVFSFPEQTQDGIYHIQIPAGFFNVTIDNEVLRNQIISKDFYISDVIIPEITPAQGVLSSNTISEVKLTLPADAEIIAFLPNTSYNRLYPMGEDGEPDYGNRLAYFSVVDTEVAIGGNEFTLRPTTGRPVVLQPGNYIFITPAYLYTLYGGSQPGEGKYYWTALQDYPVLGKPAVSPAEGEVKALDFFTLTLPEAQGDITKVNNILSYIYPVNADGTYGPAVATLMSTKGLGKNTVDLVGISPVDCPNGKYALVTPKGLYLTDGSQADTYTFTFEYSGSSSVSDIAADANGLYDVYSLTGICVLRNATAADLDNLEKGFYIINGKKVCKR